MLRQAAAYLQAAGLIANLHAELPERLGHQGGPRGVSIGGIASWTHWCAACVPAATAALSGAINADT